MLKHTPKNYPEVKLVFEYLPAEYDYKQGHEVCPASIEIHEVHVNGSRATNIEDYLLERFGDLWEREILDQRR